MQSSRRIDDDHVGKFPLRFGNRLFGGQHGVLRSVFINGNTELFADDLELLNRGGPVDIASGEQNALAVVLGNIRAELAAHGGLARALQPRHEDDRGLLVAEFELGVFAAHEARELFIYDLDDLLSRRQALEPFAANGAVRHGLDEILNDHEVDVRFQQGELDLAHGFLHVAFVELSPANLNA